MRPFFSIIIPTLNEEKYLPKLLDSLLAQKERDFEVIVVDAKSEDKTVEVVKEFKKKYKKNSRSLDFFVSLKRNVSYQRNLGAQKARGGWLVFFDADSQAPQDYLLKIKREIKMSKAAFLTTWVEADSPNPDDKIIAFFASLLFETMAFLEINFVPGFNMIVEKRVFKEVGGFEEKVIHAEDLHFAHRLRKKGYLVKVLKEPKVVYSLRRFRKEGKLTVLRKYTQAALHLLFKGPITKALFDYEMGGHLYKNQKSKSKNEKLKTRLKRWRKKIMEQLREIERVINGE